MVIVEAPSDEVDMSARYKSAELGVLGQPSLRHSQMSSLPRWSRSYRKPRCQEQSVTFGLTSSDANAGERLAESPGPI